MPPVLRTDQIGSLVRPQKLLDAREDYKGGRIGLEALRRVEDECILEALKMQKDTGIDIFTDGEFRRDAWQTNISQAVDGFEKEYPVNERPLPDGTTLRLEMHTKPIVGKLRQLRRLADVDAAFLKEHSPGPFKITMPSPSSVARSSYRAGITDKAYPDPAELQGDVVRIIKAEMEALSREGVEQIQLDEGFTVYVRDDWRESLRSQGEDPEKVLAQDIAADNECYDAVRWSGASVSMHLCRGSRTASRGAGGYDWLAEHLFDALHVDRFLLEYDSEAAGGFEPLRFLPKGKIAVLGIVTTKDARLETEDEVLRRIDEAAKHCPLDQLALSSQCGFQAAANADGTRMTIEDQVRKLELIARVGRKVWG
jgi:5-methyltetrahydropteroyltriglutamate--homocysteine methyltransferase